MECREKRTRLHTHAAHAWGPRNKENQNGAPEVFSLVSKSAEGVRAMSAEVNQEVTDSEERVALNKFSQGL
jgi:hypothetical protein